MTILSIKNNLLKNLVIIDRMSGTEKTIVDAFLSKFEKFEIFSKEFNNEK